MPEKRDYTPYVLAGAAVAAGVGIYLALKKPGVKKAGDKISAKISLSHLGPGGRFDIGFGVAQTKLLPPAHIDVFFMETVVVGPHTTKTKIAYQMKGQELPSLSPGTYHAIPVLQVEGGPRHDDLKGFIIIGAWTKNVFKIE